MPRTALVLLFVVIAGWTTSGGAQGWPARYDGPSAYFDEARDVAADADGNVYVTGSSQGLLTENCAPLGYCTDFATIKYGADGSELWVRRYEGPGSRNDNGRAIGLDSAGNVYVTGDSYAPGTAADFATVKYAPDGTELWVARYDGPASIPTDIDEPVDLAVDADGNVYVTGRSRGTDSTDGFATVKYDSDGTELWVRRYEGPSGGQDAPRALTVDASGNVYVTGVSDHATSGLDYLTLKYDAAGNELWVARYNGPGVGDDEALAVAVDSAGNVFVTGRSAATGTADDYLTVKYDPDGEPLWVARYDGPTSGNDVARALGVDGDGNAFVTGASTDANLDYATIKYSPDGVRLWVRRHVGTGNQDDEARDLLVDDTGAVYVTGESGESGRYDDYTTIKYAPDGTRLWIDHYDEPPGYFESATAIALDFAANVYVTGVSNSDYATVKIPQPHRLSVSAIGLGSGFITGPGIDCPGDCEETFVSPEVVDLSASPGSGSYFSGWSDPACGAAILVSGYRVCHAVFDPMRELWDARYDGSAMGADEPSDLFVDTFGNAYVTGRTVGVTTDYITLKYDAQGNEDWAVTWDGADESSDLAEALTVDASGNVYVTGRSYADATGWDWSTVKYDADGNEKWAVPYDGSALEDRPYAIGHDGAGNVYVAGSTWDGADWDLVLVKYNPSGSALWTRTYDSGDLNDDYALDMAVTSAGDVYLAGYLFTDPVPRYSDLLALKYDTNGTRVWVDRLASPIAERGLLIALDNEENAYVAGYTATEGAWWDYLIVKYTAGGARQWTREWGDDGRSTPAAIAVDNVGRVVVTGDDGGAYGTVRYDASGNVDWSTRHDDTGYSGATDVAIGTGDEITVTGHSWRSGTSQDYETLRYSSEGDLIWSVRYDSPESSSDEAYDMALSPLGATIVTGRSYQAATSSDIFTIAYGAEELDPFGLAVGMLGAGTGEVTSDPVALECGEHCEEALPTDLEVDLFATPTAGSTFLGWGGDPDCTDGSVTIDGDVVCEAEFDFVGAQNRMLVVDLDSFGVVTSHPSGVSCPPSCAAEYVHTTAVTLSVSPPWVASAWAWSGDADCADGIVTMTAETHCTGTFLPEPSQGVLLSAGLAALVAFARRRRSSSESL